MSRKSSVATNLTAYNDAVGRVKELLDRWLESGVDLFLELRKIELAGDWKAPGYTSFTDFLRKEFPNAIGFERYNNVIQAIELHGTEFVRKIGVHACHTVTVKAIADNVSRIHLLQKSVEQHVHDTGVAPGPDKIRDIVRGIAPETVKPARETRSVSELAAAQLEIKRLQARVRELEKECERLTKELTARKPSAKRTKSKRR